MSDPYWGDEVPCRDGTCDYCGKWETVATVNGLSICPVCDEIRNELPNKDKP